MHIELRNTADQLHEYSAYCNDELGEVCESMVRSAYKSALMSDKLQTVLCKEMQAQLEWFEENMEVVEVTETITKTFKELVEK